MKSLEQLEISHLVVAFVHSGGDAALAARDAKARKSEAVAAAVDNFDLSELSKAAARIENAISWNDADQQIIDYEDDDDEYHEEDVGWYSGDCDDELDDTAYTAGTPTDDPELLEQFEAIWNMLMRPHLKCMLQQVEVPNKHVSLWLVSRVPEAIILLLVLVLLMAWLSHPLIENL